MINTDADDVVASAIRTEAPAEVAETEETDGEENGKENGQEAGEENGEKA